MRFLLHVKNLAVIYYAKLTRTPFDDWTNIDKQRPHDDETV